MKAITYYNLGYSQTEVANLLSSRHRIRVPRRTISEWIARYRPVCTYAKLRDDIKPSYPPDQLILTYTMEHRQVYEFQFHQAKIKLLSAYLPGQAGVRLRDYLNTLTTDQYPHYLFQDQKRENHPMDQSPTPATRSSKVRLETLPLVQTEKQNLANDLATLGLVVARTTRERHPAIQEFMLVNDSTTVACEIPIYLTDEDIKAYRHQGLQINYPNLVSPITGHIDLIQIRNGLINILDYKPDAHKIQPISQLLTYALALASRCKLPLKLFKCAWFDDKSYYEFYPLQAVYSKDRQPIRIKD